MRFRRETQTRAVASAQNVVVDGVEPAALDPSIDAPSLTQGRESTGPRQRSRTQRLVGHLGTVLLGVGALAIIWAVVTWRAGDPLTALYQRYEQRSLRAELSDSTKAFDAQRTTILKAAAATPEATYTYAEARSDLERLAHAYRRQLSQGDPVGVLTVPELGLRTVVVDGTSAADLRRGPGLDRRTFVPGEDELVYVAGHRTTYGAPFAHIDSLRPGDFVYFELPYAKLTYRITGRRIVDAGALGVLRSRGHEHLALQACHPRFFATQRYIADAKLVRFSLALDGTTKTFVVAHG